MKKLSIFFITMLLASIILFSCKKTDSISNSNNSNAPFVGNWYVISEKYYSANYQMGNLIQTYRRDSSYSPSSLYSFNFLNTGSLIFTNPDSSTTLPYKVLDNTHAVIDLSKLDDTSYNIYLIDTFNYKFNGNNLTLWYNREVLYKSVSNGMDPQYVSYYDGAFPLNYDISNPTYHSLQSDTFNFVKQ